MKKFFYHFLTAAIVLATIFSGFHKAQAAYGDVSTFIGKIYDGDGGNRVDAYFDFPEDLDIDSAGSFYIADTYNNVIRKIDANGLVSTLAGTGSSGFTNGAATAAEFALPRGVAVGADGAVYVADTANNAIRKISDSTVSTLVATGLSGPEGVEVYGSTVYIADTGNNAIKTVATSGGTASILSSSLSGPKKLAVNSDGSIVYIADAGSHRVLSVSTSDGSMAVIAGSGEIGSTEGVGAAAKFNNVWGVALDGTTLYVSDGNGYSDYIRKIDLATNTTSLFAADSNMASINFPAGLKVYNSQVYVANAGIGTIHRFYTGRAGDEEIFAGIERFGNRNGAASVALFGRPYDLTMTADRTYMYVADNNKIRRITRSTGEVAQVIGSSVDNYREGDDDPLHYAGPARFSTVQSLVVNSTGTRLYVVDRWNNRIRGINLEAALPYSYLVTGAGSVNTLGTDDNGYQEGTKCADQFNKGVSGCAYFRAPAGLAISPDNAYLYVSDTGNNRIRKVRISDGQTSLIAGSGEAGFADGTGSAAKFNRPFGITINSSGSNLYVADSNNQRIRKIDLSTNAVTTVVGNGNSGYQEAIGTSAVLSYPEYVKWGSDGYLYFSEVGSHRVRQIDPTTALTKLVAGSGTRGFANGARTTAEFNNPKGLVVDPTGNALYIADTWNDQIRKVDITGSAPYSEPTPTVTAVSPTVVNPTWDKGSGLQVKISGTNFRYGAKAYFGDYLADKTYVMVSTAIAGKLPLSKLKPGIYDVTVVNLDGQQATLERALSITDAAGKTSTTYYPYSKKTAQTITKPLTAPSIKVAEGATFMAYASTLRAGFDVTSGRFTADGGMSVVTVTGDGLAPQIRIFNDEGQVTGQFFAYSSATRTGVKATTCDVNGDGLDEILTVPGKGGKPLVKIFNAKGQEVSPAFYALDGKFLGGAYLACGDINGDEVADIIVSAARGGGAQVMVYTLTGQPLANFFAYAKTFRGGIKVAALDMDNDGKDEIATGPEYGAPHIQIFKIKTNSIVRLSPGFYAFGSDYRGGVSVAGADVNGDGKKELVVGVGANAAPLVKVYNISGTMQKQFYAYAATFLGGVNLSGGDVDGDGADELLVVPRSNGGPQVKIINVDEV